MTPMPSKRFVLTGGGAWNQYVERYDTPEEAKQGAVHWLDMGYDAWLYEVTGQDWKFVCEYRYRYDGLGKS